MRWWHLKAKLAEGGMASVIPVISARRWIEYLAAILLGNAIYYLSLSPHLPAGLRHEEFKIDLGMLLDFGVCVAAYWLIRLGEKVAWPDRS
jgi:ABC-type uncharacterized transport system permease subunit